MIFKRNKKTLSDIDEVYKNMISDLSKNQRIEYCERYIERINYELKISKTTDENKRLKSFLDIAYNEIKNLK